MSWVWALLVLQLAISKTVVGQCEYIYIAEPPGGQLFCNPLQINRLQLVCSIFVADISPRSDVLRIQWFFSAPINRQFNPANAVLLQEVSFEVVQRETFTSRVVVSSPPIGFYFCQPLLSSGRQLLRSNVVPLQPPFFFLERNIRPCLINEFQNCSRPFCAIPGVNIGPNQIIAPAPTVIGTVQYITRSPTAINIMTPTALLELQQTPVARNDVTPDNINAGLIAGVVVSGIVVFIVTIIVIVVIVVLCQVWQKKINSKFPKTYNSRRISNGDRYATPTARATITEQVDEVQEGTFVPPNKPPPTLKSLTNKRTHVTNHRYNRLIRFPKAGKNSSRIRSISGSESSAYYITPEHDNNDGVEYYGEFDEEHIETPYVDESESLIYTDSHYGAESDIYLQQQRKQQMFITSSSLELQADKEGTHARKAANTINATNQMVHSQHKYQNCVLRSKYDNAVLKPTSKKATIDTDSTPYYQEIIATRELGTEYTNAEILESTAV